MSFAIGQTAPDFTLPDQAGKEHRLSDYSGQYVLIYFYPKDDTPGCTTEACSLRDNWEAFKKHNAVVLGISIDSVKSHEKFAAKFDLPFTILSDADKKVVELYGVWGLKKFMGRSYEGTVRSSFLVAPDGKLAAIYAKVKPAEHADQVLADIKKLTTRSEATANPS